MDTEYVLSYTGSEIEEKLGKIDSLENSVSEQIASAIPTSLKNPNALTINGVVYDGSEALTVDIADGEDGISPTVAVSKSGKVTTITVADVNGTKTATINDGENGRYVAQSEPPEDTSVLWIDTDDNSIVGNTASNPLYGKSISFNGDSICSGAENNGTLGGYGKIIADRNSMSYQNIAVGGAVITAELYSSSGNALPCISRTISNMDETADYAIVEGGINDSAFDAPMGAIIDGFSGELDETTYCGAFENMLKQLILRFPGKKIGYIAVHTNGDGFASGDDTNYYAMAKKCCEKWGVPFCDLNNTVPPLGRIPALRTAYTVNGDGVHPTDEGYRKLYCDKIEAWLKTL